MIKKFLTGVFTALVFSSAMSIITTAAETDNRVKIDSSGKITLVSDNEAYDEITALQLSLKVNADEDADVSFTFNDEDNINISEYRYNSDTKQLNIYLSGTDPLFEDNLLDIGTVSVKDKSGNDVSFEITAPEESLKYVYNNKLVKDNNLNIDTVTTTETTTTTTTTTETFTTTTTAPDTETTTETTVTTTELETTATTETVIPTTSIPDTETTTETTVTTTEPETTSTTEKVTTTTTAPDTETTTETTVTITEPETTATTEKATTTTSTSETKTTETTVTTTEPKTTATTEKTTTTTSTSGTKATETTITTTGLKTTTITEPITTTVTPSVNETYDKVKIDDSGKIILISHHAADNRITTLQLSLNVDTDEDADVSFTFNDEDNIKISEYRYNSDTKQLNIYLSGTDPLFEDSLLDIGIISVKDKSGNNVSFKITAPEKALKYVYQDQFVESNNINIDIVTNTTTTEPTTTTTYTTTETEPVTSNSSTETTAETNENTKPETTTATTENTKPETTTATTEETKPDTTTVTTEETKPETTTVTTEETKPDTTATTTEKTKPITETTTSTASTTTNNVKNISVTVNIKDDINENGELEILSDGFKFLFDSNAVNVINEKSDNGKIKFNYKELSDTDSMTITNISDEQKLVVKEILNNGGKVFDLSFIDDNGESVIFSNEAKGSVTITVPYNALNAATDINIYYIADNGEKLNMNGTYDAENHTVTFTTTHFSLYSIEENLPQTGNNSLKNILTAVSAFMMILFGVYSVKLFSESLIPEILSTLPKIRLSDCDFV